ncbi:MAG: efflux RND transporter periplasmic adaptor subunit [Bythopirellula sp.]
MIVRRVYAFILSSGFVCLACAAFSGCGTPPNEYVAPPPAAVSVMHPIQQTLTQTIEENGMIEAVEVAEVRARVRGFVEEITFEPGQAVQVGDVLYRIEKDQYEAAKNSAVATLASAEAAITVAEAAVKSAEADFTRLGREFERTKELVRQNVTTQSEYDEVAAAYASAIADVRSSKASVEAAQAEKGRAAAHLAQVQLDLDYTTVRAPIGGKITKTGVKLGNLVDNGHAMASVINDTRVFANFNVSDREILRYRKAKQAALEPGEQWEDPDLSKVPAYLSRESDRGFPFEGRLEYADEQGIDASTGTLAMRAIFENPHGDLFPGLFVQMRVPIDRSEALLVPELATGRDQLGSFALTVDNDEKVERKAIVISRKLDGWVVVTSGLTTSDRVVVAGIQRARPGTQVAPELTPMSISDEALTRGFTDEQPAAETGPPAEPVPSKAAAE